MRLDCYDVLVDGYFSFSAHKPSRENKRPTAAETKVSGPVVVSLKCTLSECLNA